MGAVVAGIYADGHHLLQIVCKGFRIANGFGIVIVVGIKLSKLLKVHMYNLFNPLIHKGKSPLKLFGLDRNTNRQPDSAIETRTVHNDFFELVSYIAILHQMHNGVRSKGDPETGCF